MVGDTRDGLSTAEAVKTKVTAVECWNGAFPDGMREKGRDFCSKEFIVCRGFQLSWSEQVYCEICAANSLVVYCLLVFFVCVLTQERNNGGSFSKKCGNDTIELNEVAQWGFHLEFLVSLLLV